MKAILGPWNHSFPHDADPGPAIEWRDEATRWWDYWLKGKQNGIMDEPRFEVYMRHCTRPTRIFPKCLASGGRKNHGHRVTQRKRHFFSAGSFTGLRHPG